jgi:Zn-finger nucleic acid-binding protein
MNCPKCSEASLSVTYRTGIEIDFCPKCRGVWLDRGELDKMLHRGEREWNADRENRDRRAESREQDNSHESGRDENDSGRHHSQPDRRRSWFSELFD